VRLQQRQQIHTQGDADMHQHPAPDGAGPQRQHSQKQPEENRSGRLQPGFGKMDHQVRQAHNQNGVGAEGRLAGVQQKTAKEKLQAGELAQIKAFPGQQIESTSMGLPIERIDGDEIIPGVENRGQTTILLNSCSLRASEYNRGTGCGNTARPGLCGGAG